MKNGTVCWPNGSRIAIAITVMFETWSDDKWPPYAAQRWQPKPGAKDHQSMTWGQYGGKAGIWRILRILDECSAPATFCANARSVEVYPEATAQVVRSGHDFAAHGYTQDQHLADMTPEQEHATIKHCIEVLEQKTGTRPEGWLSPILAWTEHTDDMFAHEKLLWHGDANYTDVLPSVSVRIQADPNTDFRLGYGIGFSFRTPLGPIRLDFGFNQSGGSRTHFIIGTSF